MNRYRRTIRAGISIVLFVLLCATVRLTTVPGSQVYEMVFHRSFVQYLSLFTFVLILTLVGDRAWTCWRSARRLRQAKQEEQHWTGDLVFGEDADAFGKELARNGHNGVPETVLYLADLWRSRMHGAYEFVGSLICLLPALGLFGTMLGIHDALFASFGQGGHGPEAVNKFVGSLAVALDTTVLALGAALIGGAMSWIMQRLERAQIEQRSEFVRQALAERFAAAPATDGDASVAADHGPCATRRAVALQSELRVLLTGVLEQALSRFDQRLREVVASNRVDLADVVADVFERQHVHEQAVVERLADEIRKSMGDIESVLKQHNTVAMKRFAASLGHLSQTISRRIPGELVIRYDGNGRHEAEDDHDI